MHIDVARSLLQERLTLILTRPTRRSMGAAAGYSRPHWVMADARVILSPGTGTRLRAAAEKLAEQAWASFGPQRVQHCPDSDTARGRTQAAALVRGEGGIIVRPAAMGGFATTWQGHGVAGSARFGFVTCDDRGLETA